MVHGLLSFLSDVYGLLDPSGKTLRLSVDHRRLRPVDDKRAMSSTGLIQATVIDRARTFYQMDQTGHTYPKGRTTGHEP